MREIPCLQIDAYFAIYFVQGSVLYWCKKHISRFTFFQILRKGLGSADEAATELSIKKQ